MTPEGNNLRNFLTFFDLSQLLRRSGCDRGPALQVQLQDSVQVVLHDDQRGLPIGFGATQTAGGTETRHLTIRVQAHNAQGLQGELAWPGIL